MLIIVFCGQMSATQSIRQLMRASTVPHLLLTTNKRKTRLHKMMTFKQKLSIATTLCRPSSSDNISLTVVTVQMLLQLPTFNTPSSASHWRTTWPHSSRGLSPRMRCAHAAARWSATTCGTGAPATATTLVGTWRRTYWYWTTWSRTRATATSCSTSLRHLVTRCGLKKPNSTPHRNLTLCHWHN